MSKLKLGPCCSVVGCSLRPGTNLISEIKVYRFPKNKVQRNAWITAVKREGWVPTSNSRICSTHFISGKPSDDPLSPDYVPSKLPHRPDSSRKMDRYQRSLRRTSAACSMEGAVEDMVLDASAQDGNSYRDMSVGTDMSMNYITELQNENTSLRERLEVLETKLLTITDPKKMSETSVDLNNDRVIKFYTGLPSSKVFFTLLTYLTTAWMPCTASPTPALQFYMVLMKLRLGLSHQDLGYRFQCSCGRVSTIFHDWLNVMSQRLKCLIHWPSKEEVKRNLPAIFRNPPFSSVRCIIDCSEIFIDRPTSLSARAQTYSNYKSHNTIKFLLGVSPTGAVTFLTKAWGGRASDKTITKSSDLISLLEDGDVVLADRGFNFPEYFATKGVQLLIPASTRGRKQLSGLEVTRSRQMSRIRIHVERAIGRLKNYHILRQTLPISLVKRRDKDTVATVDKILVVCSALCNLDKPLVL